MRRNPRPLAPTAGSLECRLLIVTARHSGWMPVESKPSPTLRDRTLWSACRAGAPHPGVTHHGLAARNALENDFQAGFR